MRLAITSSILSLFLTTSAFAQGTSPSPALSSSAPAESEPQTLTGGTTAGSTQVTGWFLAPTLGATGFGGQAAYSPGLRGGIYLNRRLAIGLTAQAIGSDASVYGPHDVRNVGTYGGLLLQYVAQSNRLFHATFESTIGSGRWCAVISDANDGCSGRDFLVFEPVANLEINLSKHLRIATGVGYRFAVAGSGAGPSSRDMSSLVTRTSLVFGSF